MARIQAGQVASVQIQYDRNRELARKIASRIESSSSIQASLEQSSPPESPGVQYERDRVTLIVRSR